MTASQIPIYFPNLSPLKKDGDVFIIIYILKRVSASQGVEGQKHQVILHVKLERWLETDFSAFLMLASTFYVYGFIDYIFSSDL